MLTTCTIVAYPVKFRIELRIYGGNFSRNLLPKIPSRKGMAAFLVEKMSTVGFDSIAKIRVRLGGSEFSVICSVINERGNLKR